MSYPDPTLNSTYTYDTGAFGKGRLAGITRHGETLAYTYDRFGRLLQDGALAYTWDKNGNRATITYPEAITATYDHDFAETPCMSLCLLAGDARMVMMTMSAGPARFSATAASKILGSHPGIEVYTVHVRIASTAIGSVKTKAAFGPLINVPYEEI
ncbi:MAG TPA: hypothetical protein VEW48_12705 [Thermoanaerobaculia bacterium]|nr:hypothetical protein [Thermoanaerobaculia bacterium]